MSTTRATAIPDVLEDPILDKGTAFTEPERDALGLTGRLPSAVLTLDRPRRAERVLAAAQAKYQAGASDGAGTTGRRGGGAAGRGRAGTGRSAARADRVGVQKR